MATLASMHQNLSLAAPVQKKRSPPVLRAAVPAITSSNRQRAIELMTRFINMTMSHLTVVDGT